jgi:hypothetical protein
VLGVLEYSGQLVGVEVMVVVTGDDVGDDKGVEFVAHSVRSVLFVATTFGFDDWDLHIPKAEIVEMLGTCLREVLRPATWLIAFVLLIPS